MHLIYLDKYQLKTKIMKNSIKLFSLALLFLSSCVTDIKTDNYINQRTLVYADFSNSQDKKSVIVLAEKVVEIFKNQPTKYNTYFVVKAITKDKSEQEIFSNSFDKINTSKHLDKNHYKIEVDNIAKILEDTILKFYEEISKGNPLYTESCICNSLDNSYEIFSGIDTSICKTQVIFISDMVEECDKKSSNLKQNFYMHRKKSVKELKKLVIDNYTPRHKLSEYIKPENLFFIYNKSSEANTSDEYLIDDEIENIWAEILLKHGYRNYLNSFNFTSHIPNRLLNNNLD